MTQSQTTPEYAATPEVNPSRRTGRLIFRCPRCQRSQLQPYHPHDNVQCRDCGWTATGPGQHHETRLSQCAICGCRDLWRQKDFPQRLGLLMVGLGILSSTVAYALWQPSLALGILMAFALVDAALFLFMPDVQVCYRCGARYRGLDFETEKTFELETAERYRQERMRLESSGRQPR